MVPRRVGRRLGGVVLLLAATTGVASAPAGARPDRSPMLRTVDDFEGASQAEQAALSALASARRHRAETAGRLDVANREVAHAQAELNQVNADRLRLEQARLGVEAELHRTSRRVAGARARARRAAAVLYRNSGGGADLVFGGSTTGPRTRHSEYLRTVGADLSGRVDGLRAAEDDARRARRDLARRRAEVERITAVVDRRLATVTAERDALARAATAAQVDEGRVQQVLVAAQARRAEFERAAAVNAAASTSVAQILAARGGGQATPSGLRLRLPADGPISSRFGRRLHPIFHTWRMHAGVDIGAGYGTPVRAAAAGQVVVAGVITGYGNAIVVDHGDGIATLYGHLSRFGVRRGAQVDAGEAIGAVGNTGNSTGPHLHFEVRVNGTPVDPLPYLP
jgi:murein DD-endopeptidase MepM/ murein hydrolase activator NlpD